jgi:hypothetical protein
MGKKKKLIISEQLPRVPSAIYRGLIEGYSYPYIESIKTNLVEIIKDNKHNNELIDPDPISYEEKIPQGSGLNAIKSLRLKIGIVGLYDE